MENIEINVAEIEDLQPICDLVRAAGQADLERGYSPAWLGSPVESVRRAITAGHMRILRLDGELAGCFSLDHTDEEVWGEQQEEARYLHCLTIAPFLQGNGIGRRIVELVEQETKEAGVHLVRFDVPVAREKTRAWYKAMGYDELDVLQPPSYSRPTVQMQKRLSGSG